MLSLSSGLQTVVSICVATGFCWVSTTQTEVRDLMDHLLLEESTGNVEQSRQVSSPAMVTGLDGLVSTDPRTAASEENGTLLQAGDQLVDTRLQDVPRQHHSRIDQIGNQLRQMGASYMLLERWRAGDGPEYRFRCDLAGVASPVKCSFEVMRPNPVEAMEEVLRAVSRIRKNPG